MKSITRLTSAALLAAVIAAAFLYIRAGACGPDWEPDVFIPAHHPASITAYVNGRLGVLQRGYYHAEFVVAYRYLTGVSLTPAEKAVLIPKVEPPAGPPETWEAAIKAREAAQPISQWLAARGKYVTSAQATISQERSIRRKTGTWAYEDNQLNCTDGAFLNAAVTLNTRAQIWGSQSAEVREWITGQDAVFANCRQPSEPPSASQPGWPKLLQQDRAYQVAAAEFYSERFDDATRDFDTIARDTSSPWSRWGKYLAARAIVRKAAAAPPSSDSDEAVFDLALLRGAQVRLEGIVAHPPDAQILHAAKDELGYVMARVNPSARLTEVSTALAQPDPDFRNHLTDLDVLLDRGKAADTHTDLVAWIHAMQSPARQEPGNRSGLPWLVAGMAAAQMPDPKLIAAAATVPASSPAYVTVNYHRARLLRTAGKADEARAITTSLLQATPAQDPATRNALLQQRMPTAHTLDEFLADAPRTALSTDSQYAAYLACPPNLPAASQCQNAIPPLQFDADAATYLNREFPLSMLAQSAESRTLPINLRQAIASMAWVRAVALQDPEIAARVSRLLPEPVRNEGGTQIGSRAILALLRAPGFRPYVDTGVQRSASYDYLDHFRDNWWCGRWTDGAHPDAGGLAAAPAPPLPFLTAKQREQAADEARRLNTLAQGLAWIGPLAFEYVTTHPEDKAAPEILAQLVQGTRWNCEAQTELSKRAFQLLHKRYPDTEWAKKTKYYY